MSNTIKAEGNCLCGAVKITAITMSKSTGVCHCSMCRNWSGGAFMTVDCGTDVSFEGEDNISRYSSSEWAERCFCKQCGTNLFYRLKEANQHFMSVDLFNHNEALNFDHQIFIDEKPDYYDFANETNNMTGEEVFAAYAPPEN